MVDEYAAEFLRLSQFAPYTVAEEEDWANRFQQGLRPDEVLSHITIDNLLSSSQCCSWFGQVMEKENKSRL